MNGCKNRLLSDSYVDVIRSRINELSDDLLCEDIGILCEYVILRFLKTSPDVMVATKDDVVGRLDDFISEIWPFLLTFITLVNSQPIKSPVSKLFGTVFEDTEA